MCGPTPGPCTFGICLVSSGLRWKSNWSEPCFNYLCSIYDDEILCSIYDGGIFFGSIYGDILVTVNQHTQVAVWINDVPAHCSGSCFQILLQVHFLMVTLTYWFILSEPASWWHAGFESYSEQNKLQVYFLKWN